MIRRAGLIALVVAAFGGATPASVAIDAAVAAPRDQTATTAAFRPANRYALAGSCVQIVVGGRPTVPADAPFRMQAAALGQYLLYGTHQDYVDRGLTRAATPSPDSIWTLTGDRHRGYALVSSTGGAAMAVTFARGRGCAVYPEAQVDAVGKPFAGASAASAVRGTTEGHAHITAFELFGGDWHCGRPSSPYGAPYALPASCAPYQQGSNGAWETVLDFGGATRPSDMHGWPTFKAWPSPTALAEEGDYWTGLKRAWLAGLRLVISNNVDNEDLCQLMTTTSHACLDMVSVHLQAHDLYVLQNYIDAQSGGPGKGFFRIVTNPFQARRVINQGKLAVIMGIEVSKLFECGEMNNQPECNQAQVDAGLKEVERLGVRTFFPVHEFNNAFGGSKMISGESGIIINAGNRKETGSFFTLAPCPADQADAQQETLPVGGAFADLLNGPFASLLGGNPAPAYSSGPKCNTDGLTSLGAYLINKMIQQHMIIQLDHMDSKTADAALTIAEAHHFAGVVSAHCCNSPQLFKRMYAVGGAVDAPKDQPAAFLTLFKQDAAGASAQYSFGFGFGSDMNGLSQQTGPNSGPAVHYPFKSFDGGVTFSRERWGDRVFDINKDGVANYGMFADWLNATEQAGGSGFTREMFNGAEAYLEMWERAYGVRSSSCLRPGGTVGGRGAGPLRLGASFKSALYAAGQPTSRIGTSYRWCLAGGPGSLATVFNPGGSVAIVASSGHGYSAGGVRPGARAHWNGVRIGPAAGHGARFALFARRGHVVWVGVTKATSSRRVRSLFAALS